MAETLLQRSVAPTDRLVCDMPGYPQPPARPPSLEEAKRLLAEAGHPGGAGLPPLLYIYPMGTRHKRLGEYLQSAWKELGIELRLSALEWKVFLDERKLGSWDLARAGWAADFLDPSNFLELFATGSESNRGGYSNPRFDALLADAAAVYFGPERLALLREAETVLLDVDQAVIPVYNPVLRNLINLEQWEGWYPINSSIHEWKYLRRK